MLAEQGHLCAYCTCRIGVGDRLATIEHLIPQNPEDSAPDGELSLDYHNLVAVCDGRGGATCDKRRGNEPLTVDPTKPYTLDSIFYHRDGRIDAVDGSVRRDLEVTLGLNASGTNLCGNRSKTMEAIEKSIDRAIKRRGAEGNRAVKKAICAKVLKLFENQMDMKEEYLGAKLYKAHKLFSKFA